MKPFQVCLLLSLAALAAAAPNSASKWESFKAKHAKKHPVHEEAKRMAKFVEVDSLIESHNAKFASGQVSFSMQHNQYSDLSDEEFRKVAFGLTAPANFNISSVPEAALSPQGPLPAAFDWRTQGKVSRVKNQESCGSCYAFAATSTVESFLLIKNKGTKDISEQDMVDCSYRKYGSMNGGCQGGWPTESLRYINEKDLVFQNEYQYVSGKSQTHNQCRIPSPVRNEVRGTIRATQVRPRTEDEIRQLLVQYGPLYICMAADGEFQKYFRNLGKGIFDMPESARFQPNHAVVLVGYGTENGKDFWVIKNSWGTGFGDQGFFRTARNKNTCNIMAYGVWYLA